MRDSFIFYKSFYEGIKELEPSVQCEIYNAIMEFEFNKNEVELSGIAKAIFTLIKPQLEANDKRYENGCKGGAPKGNQNAKKTTKKQPKNNQETTKKQPNENENENDNDNKKEIYKERFKKPTLEEVKEYCKQRNSSVNPNVFYEYFETGNWVDSKGNKVKNWKQKIITWEKQQPKQKINKEEIVPDWFNKDLNKKEEKKESDLTDEQKDRIKRLLANSGK